MSILHCDLPIVKADPADAGPSEAEARRLKAHCALCGVAVPADRRGWAATCEPCDARDRGLLDVAADPGELPVEEVSEADRADHRAWEVARWEAEERPEWIAEDDVLDEALELERIRELERGDLLTSCW